MIPRQLAHHEIESQTRKFPLTVLCDDLRNPENIGMTFRVCEAFGVQKIWFCGENTPSIDIPKVKKTARNTQKSIDFEFQNDILEVISKLKGQNQTLVGLEITDQSIAIGNYDFLQHENITLVLGSERHGISAEVLEQLDFCVKIPFFGENSSMNAVNALSIGLYEITKQLS